ncbi:MAG: site-specific DNA-methyltransferase [Methylocystis sp.]|nr:MAG: site-specific DNA-methyltransferase [Methylocystis sp.]
MAKKPIEVDALKHAEAKRKNIPTAEFESVMRAEDKSPVRLAYERRNRDLDPQLVWRGKDEQDWSDLIVQAPPLYIQEKVHPKVIIDDLKRQSKERAAQVPEAAPDLFADFNGLKDIEAKTEFYQHDQHWSNRMICGDSLSVMASLAEREGLRGKVQCIYFDPPYGIKFNSNFQWSTTSRDVKDGAKDHITREPEQVRAFRDTWRDGIHSYLTYLRDRLTVARELLHESGSIFVQIGDENVHRVRALMDEVFGDENSVGTIVFRKSGHSASKYVPQVHDFLLWYARKYEHLKFRQQYKDKSTLGNEGGQFNLVEERASFAVRPASDTDKAAATAHDREIMLLSHDNLTSDGFSSNSSGPFTFQGMAYNPAQGKRTDRHWKTIPAGLDRMVRSGRIMAVGKTLRQKRYLADFPVSPLSDHWADTVVSGFADPKVYVVQTSPKVIERCILMTTDPGDLVLDPTCGSGTTAYVAEQWGRRWITIDTSRVSLALARSRLMGARYPYYLLADSPEGQRKEGEVTRTLPKSTPTRGDIRHGFVYERVPHITLKSIANNAEIDVIWEKWQEKIEPILRDLGALCGEEFTAKDTKDAKEWLVPREFSKSWPAAAQLLHENFWEARIARQKEIDASIAAKAEFEYLYDKPYVDKDRIRVAGPFTVESLSPHRTLAVDWDDELIDVLEAGEGKRQPPTRDDAVTDFAQMVLENLRAAGVQQAHKEDRITFTSLVGWPGDFICAEGVYFEGEKQKRAGVFIGPEFGTVSRPDLVAAAREAGDAGFDVLIACAFNYDAHSAEFDKLGRLPVLKARMNPDLHMSVDLKTTSAGNLFVIFGEPDIKIEDAGDGLIRVKVFGVDVFKPQTGEVISEGTSGIALWMLDTDYNEESFFVRHAYFLGANDPYKALKTTLKAEIDQEAWDSLYSDTSRPFPKPKSGRIAVKVINHLGDEVMKVFGVG